ncbi:hypothetical protein [Leptolyngbya sp. NIES-2104]|uniref:hypothetical protein n=1 Tax=Leptolyngbya sp. NIES-2104 TaxID=1552121 RepID=UPI0006ECC316|nr:hypothetical protein [Leptolyngbya sp. NIES-2104]GAP97595.1 hypothetical protein NIES2104_41420 [Leptolyngbya sp. NIES-2104]
MQVLVDTFFSNIASGHGGNRRTAQIAELIARANLEIVQFERQILDTPSKRYLAGLSAIANPKTFFFIANHQIRTHRSLNNLAFCGFQRQLYHQVLAQHAEHSLLIWEATKNYVAPYVAKDQGFNVIAMPHNLESLVPDQRAFHESLSTEVAALAKADTVFCIAYEEMWFLRLKGVNAFYLPYYPPSAIVEQLARIRQQRETMTKDRYLILGSAGNPPTREGMIEQITWLKTLRQQSEFQVDIVGYATETLMEYSDADFTVHGAVSDAALTKFLTHTKAALVHQTASSGALTRIPEMLIAGIPVVANLNAGRSAFGYSGVYCYEDAIELRDLITRSLPPPPELKRPLAEENRFIQSVQQLSKLS